MAFKPPLTLQQLKDIQDRYPHHRDTWLLLWEIRRLHSIVLRADQLRRSLPPQGGSIKMIIDELDEQLKDEPIVAKVAASRELLLKGHMEVDTPIKNSLDRRRDE